eukprot:7328080-Lingulodinium_polyedra.AAC.1
MLRIYRIEYGEKKKLEWIKRNVKLLELWWPKEDLDKAVELGSWGTCVAGTWELGKLSTWHLGAGTWEVGALALGQVMEVDNITAVPEDVITRLAASGPVGRLLFESGLLRFMAAQVCAVIEQEVQKMLGEEKVFSLDEIEARKRSVYEMAMAIDGIELLPCKRHIDINYGKLKVKQVECEGLSHEVSLRFSSAIKHIGVADE